MKTSWHFNSAQNLQSSGISFHLFSDRTDYIDKKWTDIPLVHPYACLKMLPTPRRFNLTLLILPEVDYRGLIQSLWLHIGSNILSGIITSRRGWFHGLKLSSLCSEVSIPLKNQRTDSSLFQTVRFGRIQLQIKIDIFRHVYMSKLALAYSTEIWHLIRLPTHKHLVPSQMLKSICWSLEGSTEGGSCKICVATASLWEYLGHHKNGNRYLSSGNWIELSVNTVKEAEMVIYFALKETPTCFSV